MEVKVQLIDADSDSDIKETKLFYRAITWDEEIYHLYDVDVGDTLCEFSQDKEPIESEYVTESEVCGVCKDELIHVVAYLRVDCIKK